MILANKIQERAIDYCNIINEQVIAQGVIAHYTRTENNFVPITHKIRKDKLGGRYPGCGCEYCLTLHRYVKARLVLHRLKKQLYWDEPQPPYITIESLKKAINKQTNFYLNLRNELVELGETMKVPNSVKRKAKYEQA